MDGQNLGNIPALPPHRYPTWVNLLGIAIIIATIYSLSLLPEYLAAAKKMHEAVAAYQNGNYDESIQLYSYVLQTVPSSKTARIGTAVSIFLSSDRSNDQIALSLLKGITLDEEAWARLKKVMPVNYQSYFNVTKQ